MDKTIKQKVVMTDDVVIKKFCDVCGEEIKIYEGTATWNRCDSRGDPTQ